jgi:hypothetical protein
MKQILAFALLGAVLGLLPAQAWIALAAFVAAAVFVAGCWAMALVVRGFWRALRTTCTRKSGANFKP